jgi:hypothetical protein
MALFAPYLLYVTQGAFTPPLITYYYYDLGQMKWLPATSKPGTDVKNKQVTITAPKYQFTIVGEPNYRDPIPQSDVFDSQIFQFTQGSGDAQQCLKADLTWGDCGTGPQTLDNRGKHVPITAPNNTLWKYNFVDNTLGTWKYPKFDPSRVTAYEDDTKILKTADTLCSPYKADDCTEADNISPQEKQQFYVTENYLSNTDTGLCYFKGKWNQQPCIPGETDLPNNYKGQWNFVGLQKSENNYCYELAQDGSPALRTDPSRCLHFSGAKEAGDVFCKYQPYHPACSCINAQQAERYKNMLPLFELIKGDVKTITPVETVCWFPWCTEGGGLLGANDPDRPFIATSQRQYLPCTETVNICTLGIDLKDIHGNAIIDSNQFKLACGAKGGGGGGGSPTPSGPPTPTPPVPVSPSSPHSGMSTTLLIVIICVVVLVMGGAGAVAIYRRHKNATVNKVP